MSRLAQKNLLSACHSHKIKVDNDCVDKLDSSIHVDPMQLRKVVRKMHDLTVQLWALGEELTSQLGRSPTDLVVVTYEQLQADYMEPLGRLAKLVGIDDVRKNEALLDDEQKYQKTGKDDLSLYISNYDEIEADLADYPCLLAHLRAVEPQDVEFCHLDDTFYDTRAEQRRNEDDDDDSNDNARANTLSQQSSSVTGWFTMILIAIAAVFIWRNRKHILS